MKASSVFHLGLIAQGGAAKAAQRINQALQQIGFQSHYQAIEDNQANDFYSKILKVEKKIDYELEKYSKSKMTISLTKGLALSQLNKKQISVQDSDAILNLHWFPNFGLRLLQNRRVVVTLHDMNFFTGICHHSFDCEQFKADCGNCLEIMWPLKFTAQRALSKKQREIKKINKVVIISPSNWLAQKAKESALLSMHEVKVIRNPVPTELFSPNLRNQNRLISQISEYFVVGMLGNASGKNKDYHLLLSAYRQFKSSNKNKKIIVLVINSTQENVLINDEIHLPSLSEKEMSINLSKMDVFLYHSNADNLPNLLIECQSSGVPVVANNTGGISETFEINSSGFLTDENVESYVSALQTVLNDSEYERKFSQNARKFALRNFSPVIVANNYAETYNDTI